MVYIQHSCHNGNDSVIGVQDSFHNGNGNGNAAIRRSMVMVIGVQDSFHNGNGNGNAAIRRSMVLVIGVQDSFHDGNGNAAIRRSMVIGKQDNKIMVMVNKIAGNAAFLEVMVIGV